MVKQNAISTPSSSLSSKQTIECSTTNEDIVDKKRRQLLIKSAKRPFKRSRLLQQRCCRIDEDEIDTVITTSTTTTKSSMSKKSEGKLLRRHKRLKPCKRRMVSFDTRYNETNSVPSREDLTETERRSYYFQRDEYVGIKRNIQRTIEFLRSPTDVSLASSSTSNHESASLGNLVAEEYCVRGLECLAEDFVNEHKRRVQKSSQFAVFRFQENRRRRMAKMMSESKDDDDKSANEAHEASLTLAEIYKKSTSQCDHIAKRWGHFDAIDAGIDPSSSATAVTCATATSGTSKESAVNNNIIVETSVDNNASLSSLSCDGDDGEEEENESNDNFNHSPVVNAGESANGFDSLPNVLFNF